MKANQLAIALFFPILFGSSAKAEIMTITMLPSSVGTAPGRDRPGTALIHLDIHTTPVLFSGGFVVDNISGNGNSYSFDGGTEGWYSEPEESILVTYEPLGINSGSLRIAGTGPRDSFELERNYDAKWVATPGFYDSVTFQIKFDSGAFAVTGADFIIDDGMQAALYSTSSTAVPESSSLTLSALALVIVSRLRIR